MLDSFDTTLNTIYGDLNGSFSQGALIDRTVERNAYGMAIGNNYMWQGYTTPGRSAGCLLRVDGAFREWIDLEG
jgi:hypothetical protein